MNILKIPKSNKALRKAPFQEVLAATEKVISAKNISYPDLKFLFFWFIKNQVKEKTSSSFHIQMEIDHFL